MASFFIYAFVLEGFSYSGNRTTGCFVPLHTSGLFTFVVGKNLVSNFESFFFSLISQLTLDLYVFHVIINMPRPTKRVKHCRKQASLEAISKENKRPRSIFLGHMIFLS